MASAVDEFDPQDDLPMAVATMDHSEEFLDPNLGGDNEALGSLRDNRSFEPAPSNMEVADEPATVDVQADASALIERIKQGTQCPLHIPRYTTLDSENSSLQTFCASKSYCLRCQSCSPRRPLRVACGSRVL
eukprot:5370872-Pleurochrysis_carterae.AAC.3